MKRGKRIYFYVAPRYTSGSPSLVDEETARKVVEQEKVAYEMARSDSFGESLATAAAALGLRGIVEMRDERVTKWLVTDLITGEVFDRPISATCPICKQRGVQTNNGYLVEHYGPCGECRGPKEKMDKLVERPEEIS